MIFCSYLLVSFLIPVKLFWQSVAQLSLLLLLLVAQLSQQSASQIFLVATWAWLLDWLFFLKAFSIFISGLIFVIISETKVAQSCPTSDHNLFSYFPDYYSLHCFCSKVDFVWAAHRTFFADFSAFFVNWLFNNSIFD